MICVQIKKSLGWVFKTLPFLLESSLALLEKFCYLWSSSKLQRTVFWTRFGVNENLNRLKKMELEGALDITRGLKNNLLMGWFFQVLQLVASPGSEASSRKLMSFIHSFIYSSLGQKCSMLFTECQEGGSGRGSWPRVLQTALAI